MERGMTEQERRVQVRRDLYLWAGAALTLVGFFLVGLLLSG